jgi:sigma-E factor negative regulatory protein RseA
MPNHEEQISCLMDGELSAEETRRALERLAASPEARERWERYHLARHLLREAGDPAAFDHGFAARVSRNIETEPFFLPSSSRPRALRHAPLLRWAVAASIAALAVLASREFQIAGGDSGRLTQAMARNPEALLDKDPRADADERLRNYLAMHSEGIRAAGSDTLTQARMVSYSSSSSLPTGPGYARPYPLPAD